MSINKQNCTMRISNEQSDTTFIQILRCCLACFIFSFITFHTWTLFEIKPLLATRFLPVCLFFKDQVRGWSRETSGSTNISGVCNTKWQRFPKLPPFSVKLVVCCGEPGLDADRITWIVCVARQRAAEQSCKKIMSNC